MSREGDDCSAGLHCLAGRCRRICEEPEQCAGGTCVPFFALDYDLCLPTCDALAQDCPDSADGERQGCYLMHSGAACLPVAGDGGQGNLPGFACSHLNDCARGAGCVAIAEEHLCKPYCDYETFEGQSAPRCAPDDHCAELVGAGAVGVCRGSPPGF